LEKLFVPKEQDETKRLLCLNFNFEQNETVAAKLKFLKSSLTNVQDSSNVILNLDLFGEAKVGSCLEILELFQQESI
jgi:hypothetical protein